MNNFIESKDFTQNTFRCTRHIRGRCTIEKERKVNLNTNSKVISNWRRASVRVNFSKSSLDDEPANVLSVCRACKTFSSKNDTCFSLPCCHIAADVDVNCTSRYTLYRKAHRWRAVVVVVDVVAAAAVAAAVAVAAVVSCSDRARDTDSSTHRCSSFLSATDRPSNCFDNRSKCSRRSSIEHLLK